ncbi:MAG: hypothetical protein HYT77_05495 [Deltaproteobacteria bacterium]|nr:hypothetical protein [Deltaproteobacteria bacterium]
MTKTNESSSLPLSCGNGTLDGDELCDDGNRRSGDGCSPDCEIECKNPPCSATCGNGILETGEACDQGEANNGRAGRHGETCRNNCRFARCGDGIVDRESGEECDGTPACRTDCTQTICGDGIVEGSEQCDDGASNSNNSGIHGETCRNNCRLARCGDGIIDETEECDGGPTCWSCVRRPTTLYISPGGSNLANRNSREEPWKTWDFALQQLQPGDTLIVMNGTWSRTGCDEDDPIPCLGGSPPTPMPYVECATFYPYYRNGTEELPITIRAENERRVLLKSSGCEEAFTLKNCSYWRVEGLRAESRDASEGECGGPFGKSLFEVHHSDYIELRRLLGKTNNRYFNTHIVNVVNSSHTLIEEIEAYNFHRHGISVSNSSNVTVRRAYVHSRGRDDIESGYGSHDISQHEGDEGITLYFSDNSLIENSIAEQSEGIQATGSWNHLYGNMTIDGQIAFNFQSNCQATGNQQRCPSDLSLYARHNHGENLLALRPGYSGLSCVTAGDCVWKNATVVGAVGAWGFLAKDSIAMNGYDTSLTLQNILILNGTRPNNFGFFVQTGDPRREPLAVTGPWGGENLNAHNNYINYRPIDSAETGAWSNHSSVDPQLGGCLVYIPDDSPMQLGGGEKIGAEILYRYENGQLTDEPLWNPVTGQFPCGAIVSGVNDMPGQSCFDVHERLHVKTNGCNLPVDYGASASPVQTTAEQENHPFRIVSASRVTQRISRDEVFDEIYIRFSHAIVGTLNAQDYSLCPGSGNGGCLPISSVERLNFDRGRMVRLRLGRQMSSSDSYILTVGSVTNSTGSTLTNLSTTLP